MSEHAIWSRAELHAGPRTAYDVCDSDLVTFERELADLILGRLAALERRMTALEATVADLQMAGSPCSESGL
jgi:hypothetical protein